MWQRLHHDSLASTSQFLSQNLASLPLYSVVTADQQTGGQGRHGRTWASPAGVNLYVSCAYPAKNGIEAWRNTAQVTALSLAQALRLSTGVSIEVKWPNDLLMQRKKLAGILVQSQAHAQGVVLVIGFGINVNMSDTNLAMIDKPATSLLAETGREWDRDILLAAILDQLGDDLARYGADGFGPFCDMWREWGMFQGHDARFHDPGGVIEVSIQDILRDGSVLLRDKQSGREFVASAGDLDLISSKRDLG